MHKYLRIVTIAAIVAAAGCQMPQPPGKPVVSDRFAILFYGDGGAIGSGGLNQMAGDLRGAGYVARTYEYGRVSQAVEDANSSGASQVVIAGHSYGCDAAIRAAASIGRSVRLLALLDGSQPSRAGCNFTCAVPIRDAIPNSVQHAIVFCVPGTPIPFPGPPAPCPRIESRARATDYIVVTWANHLTIDEDATVRNAVVDACR